MIERNYLKKVKTFFNTREGRDGKVIEKERGNWSFEEKLPCDDLKLNRRPSRNKIPESHPKISSIHSFEDHGRGALVLRNELS